MCAQDLHSVGAILDKVSWREDREWPIILGENVIYNDTGPHLSV